MSVGALARLRCKENEVVASRYGMECDCCWADPIRFDPPAAVAIVRADESVNHFKKKPKNSNWQRGAPTTSMGRDAHEKSFTAGVDKYGLAW